MSLSRVKEAGLTLLDNTRGQALHVLDHAFKISEAWPDTRALLLAMSPLMEQSGNWWDWIGYLQQGIIHSQQQQDQTAEAELNLHLGILYQHLGEYDLSRVCLISSIVHFKRQNNRPKLAKALNKLAYLFCLQSQYTKSGNLVHVTEQLLEVTDSERANCHLVRGMIAFEFRDWDDAAYHFQQAIQIWEEVGNQREIARNLRNLGGVKRMLEKSEEAISCNLRALTICRDIHDPVLYAGTEMNLGIIYYGQGQLEEAKKLYDSAESVFRRVQARLSLARLHTNQAQVYRELQEWEMAQYVCLASIQLWQALGNIRWTVNAMDELGLIYKEQGKRQKALETFQEALNQLKKIQNHPGHSWLLKLIEKHIAETEQGLSPEPDKKLPKNNKT